MKPSLDFPDIVVCIRVWMHPLCAERAQILVRNRPVFGRRSGDRRTIVAPASGAPPARRSDTIGSGWPRAAGNTEAAPETPPVDPPKAEPVRGSKRGAKRRPRLPHGRQGPTLSDRLTCSTSRSGTSRRFQDWYDVRLGRNDFHAADRRIQSRRTDRQRNLKTRSAQRLKDVLNNPEVDVSGRSRSTANDYFVYGGVVRPGEFPLDEKTTIMDALSVVGGFKDFAKPNKIEIQRGTAEFPFQLQGLHQGQEHGQEHQYRAPERRPDLSSPK